MSVLTLLLFIVVLILAFYLTGLIPDANGQKLARVVVLVFAILWLLSVFGVLGSLRHVRV